MVNRALREKLKDIRNQLASLETATAATRKELIVAAQSELLPYLESTLEDLSRRSGKAYSITEVDVAFNQSTFVESRNQEVPDLPLLPNTMNVFLWPNVSMDERDHRILIKSVNPYLKHFKANYGLDDCVISSTAREDSGRV